MEIHDRRRHAFFMVDNEIIRHYTPVMGSHALAVYCCLIAHASHDDSTCTMRLQTIADRAGTSVSTVRRAITTLTGKDELLPGVGLSPLVEVTMRHGEDGARVSSRYTILPVAKDTDRATVHPDTPPLTEDRGGVRESGASAHTEQGLRSQGTRNNKTFSTNTQENKTPP